MHLMCEPMYIYILLAQDVSLLYTHTYTHMLYTHHMYNRDTSCTYTYVYTRKYNMCVYMWVCSSVCTHTHTHKYAHTHTHTYTHTHTHTWCICNKCTIEIHPILIHTCILWNTTCVCICGCTVVFVDAHMHTHVVSPT